MSAGLCHLSETEARLICANPQPDHPPFLHRLAWARLKQARGQRVIQSRLPRPTPQPDGPTGPRAA